MRVYLPRNHSWPRLRLQCQPCPKTLSHFASGLVQLWLHRIYSGKFRVFFQGRVVNAKTKTPTHRFTCKACIETSSKGLFLFEDSITSPEIEHSTSFTSTSTNQLPSCQPIKTLSVVLHVVRSIEDSFSNFRALLGLRLRLLESSPTSLVWSS